MPCMIYPTASFSTTLNDLYPSFKVTPLFDAEYLINGTTYRQSFTGIPTYALLNSVISYDFEWPWVNLQNIQWYEASRGLSATAELLVNSCTGNDAFGRYTMLVKQSSSFSEKNTGFYLSGYVSAKLSGWPGNQTDCRIWRLIHEYAYIVQDTCSRHQRLDAAHEWHVGKDIAKRHIIFESMLMLLTKNYQN